MVNIPGPPGVGNTHVQHVFFLDPTLGEYLQGDPVWNTN